MMKLSLLTRKTALVALLLAAALILSGCNLVVKDPEVDAKQVILSINGEEVTKDEFTRYYNNAYDRAYEQQLMMQQYGLPAQPINQAQLLQDTLDNTARDRLLHQKAHELGLDELTEEETAALEEQAAAEYQDVLGQVKEYYFAQSELEDGELEAAVSKQAADLGLSLELYIESAKEANLHEKLHDYAGRDVTVSDEEIEAAFNAKVVQAQADYGTDPASFGTALTGSRPVYYTPAGYRYVRQILIKLNAEDEAAITALEAELSPLKSALDAAQADVELYEQLLSAEEISEEDKAFLAAQSAALSEDESKQFNELLALESLDAQAMETLAALKAKTPVYTALAEAQAAIQPKQAELDARQDEAFAAIQARTDEVYGKAIAEGADYDALVSEYSEDPGQPAAGYPVSEATTAFVESFTQGAMALAQVGDISEPIRSSFGYHILRYAADIPEGPADLETVRAALHDELFTAKEEENYNAMEEAWLAEADIKKFAERMDD
jgi:parvulin-like peptidyl-prolyl isomerase